MHKSRIFSKRKTSRERFRIPTHKRSIVLQTKNFQHCEAGDQKSRLTDRSGVELLCRPTFTNLKQVIPKNF
jgi:ribosomal protein S10